MISARVYSLIEELLHKGVKPMSIIYLLLGELWENTGCPKEDKYFYNLIYKRFKAELEQND